MCGRTSLFVPPSVLEERFSAEFVTEYVPRYNVAPRQALYAVTGDAPAAIDALEWGLLPGFVEDPTDAPRPINARAETVHEKPYFRDAFAHRRCLVLADGFYEWSGERGTREPYRIQRADGDPFAFAGLWERWSQPGEDPRRTVTIVTTDANDLLAPIHDRMPVVLGAEEERRWLEAGDPEARRALLHPPPSDELEAFPVSTAVNDPSNDTAEVVEPLDTEQRGFDAFTD